jgi:hypothetical protein
MTPHNAETISPAELRKRIDRGETGDKVAGFDPAAAPLGTDEEAAGTPTVGITAPEGVSHPHSSLTPAPQDSIAPDANPAKPRGTVWWAVVALAILAVVIWLLWR